MGLRQRIVKWFLGKMTPEEWFASFGGDAQPSSSSGEAVSQRTAMQAMTVLACVAILSEDVAKLPRHVYRKMADGSKSIIVDHPLERMLQKPNRWQDRFEFLEEMQASLLLRSNAFAAIIGHNIGRGVPTELIPINPDLVQTYEGADGSLFYRVSRNTPLLRAALETLPDMIPADSMFHLRWMSRNIAVGLSRIGVGRDAIGLALAQQRQASRFSRNAANTGGVLQLTQKISPDAEDRLKADFSQQYASAENAGKTPLLPLGVTFNKTGMSSVDAEFMAAREFQVIDICRLFRVPPHKVGVVEKSTGANLVQADQDYMNSVVSSYLERWEAKLDDTFSLPDNGFFAQFDVAGFLRADIQTRYNAYRTGIVGSFLRPNEARAAEGLPADKNGDVLMQPTNMAALGFVPAAGGAGPGSDVTGAPASGGDGDPAAIPPVPGDQAPTG